MEHSVAIHGNMGHFYIVDIDIYSRAIKKRTHCCFQWKQCLREGTTMLCNTFMNNDMQHTKPYEIAA